MHNKCTDCDNSSSQNTNSVKINNLEWQLNTASEHDNLSSGLNWYDTGSGIKKLNGNDAITYCDNLILDNHNDWRLPTKTDWETVIIKAML